MTYWPTDGMRRYEWRMRSSGRNLLGEKEGVHRTHPSSLLYTVGGLI